MMLFFRVLWVATTLIEFKNVLETRNIIVKIEENGDHHVYLGFAEVIREHFLNELENDTNSCE
jgi:hypothetical protein